jgi:hypothetical protein
LDHGAEFGAHSVHEDGKWDSEFKRHFERHGIKPIPGEDKSSSDKWKARTMVL